MRQFKKLSFIIASEAIMKLSLVHDKNTKLLAVLHNHFGKNMNLARIKLFAME